MTKCPLPDAELLMRYRAGESMASLEDAAGVSRVALWRRLKGLCEPTRVKRNVPRALPRETCPICEGERQLVQDHSYATGLCRDRICSSCNVRLAWIEKPTLALTHLEALRNYVARWQAAHEAAGGVPYRKVDHLAASTRERGNRKRREQLRLVRGSKPENYRVSA